MRADALREAGFEDRQPIIDGRECFELDLRSVGGRHLRIEPRLGFLAWRCIDVETGAVIKSAALKTLLRWTADELPMQRAPGACEPPQYWSTRDEADARAAHEGAVC
ncbi:MAG: hypothetical protein ACRC1H_03050 [Caldilineaceae bacterium]